MTHARPRALRFLGLVLALWMAPAVASREGAGIAEAVALIVYVAFGALTACLVGGVVYGFVTSRRQGQPVLKGAATGVLKGLGAFVILCAVAGVAVTGLGVLWVAFAFIHEYAF